MEAKNAKTGAADKDNDAVPSTTTTVSATALIDTPPAATVDENSHEQPDKIKETSKRACNEEKKTEDHCTKEEAAEVEGEWINGYWYTKQRRPSSGQIEFVRDRLPHGKYICSITKRLTHIFIRISHPSSKY